jgi:hypothetical protein
VDLSQQQSLIVGPVQWVQGFYDVDSPTLPGAGVDLIYQAPGEYSIRVVSGFLEYLCSSASTGRYMLIQLENGQGVVMGRFYMFGEVMANTLVQMTVATQTNSSAVAENVYPQIAIPDMILRPGWLLRFTALNKDAGDEWYSAALAVQKFYTNVPQPPLPGAAT